MKLGKWFEEIFTKKSPENSEIIAGFIDKFKFENKEVKINRMDIAYGAEGKRNICFNIMVDWEYFGNIKYENGEYNIEQSFYQNDDQKKENLKFLERAKEVLESKFEFVESPEYQTLAIRKKVKTTLNS